MLTTAIAILAATMPAQELIVTVDTTKRTPISPYIYGANFPDWKAIGSGLTLARLGGNRTTAYNWETNASNAGNDYQHQNDGLMGETNEAGWGVRTFFQPAQARGAAAIVTVPTIGYVSADKNGDGDVAKTPDYLSVRFVKSYARKPGGHFVYPPDATDKAVYQDEFVSWVEKTKSPKTPVWFSLDNEPDIWQSTHQRIHPKNATYAEIIGNNIEYASAIKAVAPKTLVFGPASYGWQGYRHFQDASDGRGRDFLDVYLASMKAAQAKHGRRLVDSLDLHWYPEARGGGFRITEKGNSETAAARIQAPRSLWDKTYVEDSWITQSIDKKPIALIPSVQEQIKKNYPGTKLSFLEYNYGGGDDVSGLIAQADVLGLYGRYGVFAACNWGVGPKDKMMLDGYRAFIRVGGVGCKFGDLGLAVSGTNPAEDSLYAALDSKNKNRLTLVAINKTRQAKATKIAVKGFVAKKVAVVVLGLPSGETRREDVTVTHGGVELSLPPLTVTSIELTR